MADSDVTATPNGRSALMDNAASAYKTVANGPLLQNVRDQHEMTSSELSTLVAARKTPANPAATGQPLTHYHSFFSELLSWNNPRASGIAYALVVAFIFFARYLDVLRYALKLTWMVLGVTVAAEVTGKMVLNNGFATQARPRHYYLVPRETLDAMIGDVHELVNFFVMEAQRIAFAENVPVSAIAGFTAFISYYLAKFVPYWGLALIFTTVTFFAPLVYKTNREAIDNALAQASDMVSAQTEQLRDVASKHTYQAANITKQYMGDYTAKAQQMLRRRSGSPEEHVKESDFPSAPTDLPLKSAPQHEPSEGEAEALAAH